VKIQQISVFLENRKGRLANIAATLGEINVNIRAMSLADTSNFGILRLIVDDTESARKVLKDRGFTVRLSQVIAVKIPDNPGSLGALLGIIESSGLNIEYVYGLSDRSNDDAVLIMGFDNLDEAIARLLSEGVSVLNREEIV